MPEGKNFFNLSSRKEAVFEEIEPTIKQVEVRICHSFISFFSLVFFPYHYMYIRGFCLILLALWISYVFRSYSSSLC